LSRFRYFTTTQNLSNSTERLLKGLTTLKRFSKGFAVVAK